MKKTFFILILAVSMLGLNHIQAQQTAPFIIPANSYGLSSTVGTFTDIADLEGTVKLGANLPDTNLKNGFFVNVVPTDPTAAANFVTHESDSTQTDPGFPLGFTFNLCGKKMTHFTVCAAGGIHFGENADIIQIKSAAFKPFYSDKKANYINFISTAIRDGSTIVDPRNITGKNPAMYRIADENGQKVLTVQYDYTVKGDEWIYQIKAYQNGNIEFIIKSLSIEHASNGQYRFFMALVENGGKLEKMQAIIKDDPFGSDALNLSPHYTHHLGITQTETASQAKGWDSITPYTSSIITGAASPAEGLYVTATQPESGRTVTMAIPEACPQKAATLKDEWYGFSPNTITATTFAGQITFDKTKITPAELTAAGTLMAVLSTSEAPDYSLDNGTYYAIGAQPSANSRVVFNAKPTYTITRNDFSALRSLDLSADNLTPATRYYLHIYAMDYKCTGAPIYSNLCQTFSFQSSIDLPKKLNAGLPTTSSVPVTVQSAGEGFGLVLLKSPNTNSVALSGKLSIGQKFGEAEVMNIISSSDETRCDIPFAAGEGAYILAVSAKDLESESPVYAADFLSLPVRAAYDGLPTLSFGNEEAPYIQNDYQRLPFGWDRTIDLPQANKINAFGLSKEYNPVSLAATYSVSSDWIDIVTPAIVPHERAVQATFYTKYLLTSSTLENPTHTPRSNDLVRIEYSVDGGAWQAAATYKGSDLPALNADGLYPISVTVKQANPESVLRLRYSFQSPPVTQSGDQALVINLIEAVTFAQGNECALPANLTPIDSLTTDSRLIFKWQDLQNPMRSQFLVSYRETGSQTTDWTYKLVNSSDILADDEYLTAELAPLKAGTRYSVRVAALCSATDTSFFIEKTTYTAFELPYEESMAQTGDETHSQSPFDRGVQTYSGAIGGTLTDPLADNWNQSYTSNTTGMPHAVGISDNTTDAWLVLPAVFIRETGDFIPKSLRFTLSSFRIDEEGDKPKGDAPDYSDTKLHVLASKNGVFTRNDIIRTFQAPELALKDSAFSIDLNEREGRLQIAFVFECPSAARENSSEEAEPKEPWYLEISKLSLVYDVDVCFPVTKLRRSLGINTLPVSWEASASAVEYGILWGLDAEEGYSDTAYTQETNYTITGLEELTRYKIMVIAYCSEDRSLFSTPVTTAATTLSGCHTPTDFAVSHITLTGADFSSKTDQPDYMTLRLVYVWTEDDDDMRIFRQMTDTLSLQDSLAERTAYLAATRAICGTDTSAMSEEIRFVTEPAATEPTAQINTQFNVRTQDGRIIIRNLDGWLIKQVCVYSLNGVKLADHRPDSRDDLELPVDARHALLFVRLLTEKGVAVYKIYLQ